jgi:hypothetical protein
MVAAHANRTEVAGTRDRRTMGVPSARATAASFARVALDDLRGRRPPRADAESHLLAAETWLCRAQDVSGDGGVSYGYCLRGGWRPSYPETSGYIATTFLRLAHKRHPSYRQRALRILEWLLAIQNADGSFANPRYGAEGIVFDTGQVLFGLVRGYEETRDPRLLAAARRAAQWLTRIADADGRWTRNEHLGTPHVYNTRTAWALLLMNAIEPDAGCDAVARRNLDWAVAEQRDSGFFEHCAFRAGAAPFTHTIAYTARGLLESAALLDEPRYRAAAVRCADAVLAHLREDGHLPSTITTAGRAAATSCCLTGNCQFAIVWLRLAGVAARPHYRQAARRALEHVTETQDLATADLDRHGAIKGSQPVWGRYAPLSYPNWATKFFVDAMWLLEEAPR